MDALPFPTHNPTVWDSSKIESPLFHEQFGSDEVAIWMNRTFARFKSYRHRFDQSWFRYEDLYLGVHWPYNSFQASDYWRAKLTINYTRAIIHSIVATVMDTDPKTTVSPSHPYLADYASGLQACLDSVWNRRNVAVEVKDALINACVYGTGYLFVYWDPSLDGGLGDVVVRQFPTECVYPQPGVRRIEEMSQCFIMRQESRAWMEEFYPDKVDLCKPSSTSDSAEFERRRTQSSGSSVGGRMYIEGPMGDYGFAGDDPQLIDKTIFSNPPFQTGVGFEERYDVLEMWCKDESLEETIYEVPDIQYDPMGRAMMIPKQVTRLEPKYKTGWRHMMSCGRITLVDEESPYSFCPVVKVIDDSTPDQFFGYGECQKLEALQFELNKRRSQMVDHATLNGGTVWLLDKNAGITQEDLANKPAQVIRYRRTTGQEIRREPGVPMPAFYMTMVELTIRDMREISGVPASVGSPPKSARSGAAFEAAQNTSTTMIRMRTHNLEVSIKQMSRMMIQLIQRYYTQPRWIRIVGHDGFQGFIPFDGRNIRGDWDITVMPGSTMNTTQSAKEQRDIELFRAHAIDQLALLQNLNYPGYVEIIRRMQHYSPPSQEPYPGFPGMSISSDTSGYAASIRGAQRRQDTPPPPPPGGQLPGMNPQVAPIAGSPGFSPKR